MATDMVLHVSEPDADLARLDDLARSLRAELLEVDATRTVVPLETGQAPEGARSGLAAAAGALLVTVQPQLAAVVKIVSLLREWLVRGGSEKRIRLEVDGDVIELTGATTELQDRLVTEWISRRSHG
ncbi:MAG TPA: hypothetical protein VFG72_14025 [Marmoricola sp.]|nr:hypothetical protein [Marmoricola sp.]